MDEFADERLDDSFEEMRVTKHRTIESADTTWAVVLVFRGVYACPTCGRFVEEYVGEGPTLADAMGEAERLAVMSGHGAEGQM